MEGYTLISGGGIQRKMALLDSQAHVYIIFSMPPELLATFFPTGDGEIPKQLRLLAKGNEWQTLLYPKTTTAILTYSPEFSEADSGDSTVFN